MNRKIRIIWDFHGPKAQGTAEHHVRHLLTFMEKEKLVLIDSGVASAADNHFMAYITVHEHDVILIRDTLKPHRALVME